MRDEYSGCGAKLGRSYLGILGWLISEIVPRPEVHDLASEMGGLK